MRPDAVQLKIVLDFDGVLFDSAFEAFSVCRRAIEGRSGYRLDVSFEEFLAFRAHVTDAWQYGRLYDLGRLVHPFATLATIAPEPADRAFADAFYAARAEMMAEPDWPEIMKPTEFFFALRPLILSAQDRFAVLSTRDVASIRRTLGYFETSIADVFGQSDIRRLGSKSAIAAAENWLDRSDLIVAYVDDMRSHLAPFAGRVPLPLHANWGYDAADAASLDRHQVLAILASLVAASGAA